MTYKTSNNHHSIICLDSGIGGLNYLETLAKKCHSNQGRGKESRGKESRGDESHKKHLLTIDYIADVDYCPYSKLPPKRLAQRLDFLTMFYQNVLQINPDTTIIACNTLSCYIIDNKLDSKFISSNNKNLAYTLPQIKKTFAARDINCSGLLVLATKYTIHSNYLQSLVKKLKDENPGIVIELLATTQLVKFAEIYYFEGNDNTNSLADSMLAELKNNLINILQNNTKINTILLGCTHFNYVKKFIAKMLVNIKRKINIIDSTVLCIEKDLAKFFKETNHKKNYNININFHGNYCDTKRRIIKKNIKNTKLKLGYINSLNP